MRLFILRAKYNARQLWKRLFYKHVPLGVTFQSNEDVSEDSDPVVCSEHEDTSVRHSLKLYAWL